MQAFLWAPRYGTTADVLNDEEGWSNIMRYVLYIIQVLIADGILVRNTLLSVPTSITGDVYIRFSGCSSYTEGNGYSRPYYSAYSYQRVSVGER